NPQGVSRRRAIPDSVPRGTIQHLQSREFRQSEFSLPRDAGMAHNHGRHGGNRQPGVAIDPDAGAGTGRRKQQRRVQPAVPDWRPAQYSVSFEVLVLKRFFTLLSMVCVMAAQTSKLPPRPEDALLAKIRAAREEPAKTVELVVELV